MILKYKDFLNENKHQGDEIKPKKLWHKSNPIFRDVINEMGLIPKKGDSYMCHSPEEECPPAIFGYWGDIKYYDSTYDDDIWEIDTSKISNTWYVDLEVGKQAVVTYDPIPRKAIKLIYSGTGKWC